MDTSWKDAIKQYDADVASGAIAFGPNGYADSYPGEAQSDASLGAFYASKLPDMDVTVTDAR